MFVIIGLVVLNVVMWTVFPPVNDGRPNFVRQYAGEVIGSTMLILMASGLFLTARAKWAEPYFGGLDKMYLTHRRVNTTAFLLIFVHVITVPITTINLRLGNYLAIIAFTAGNTVFTPTSHGSIKLYTNYLYFRGKLI